MIGFMQFYEGLVSDAQIAGDVWEQTARAFGVTDLLVIDLSPDQNFSNFVPSGDPGLTITNYTSFTAAEAALPQATTRCFLDSLNYCIGISSDVTPARQRVPYTSIVGADSYTHPADVCYIINSPSYAGGELWIDHSDETWIVYDIKPHDHASTFWSVAGMSSVLSLRKKQLG
jgi:hypothetical protein